MIPPQLDADADALGRAETSVEEARRSVKQSDGLDTADMEKRLEQAAAALASGNASQAIGLADGVVRTLERERAAMDDVLRALKQKKKLTKRFEHRDDRADWETMLADIVKAADDKTGPTQGCCLSR